VSLPRYLLVSIGPYTMGVKGHGRQRLDGGGLGSAWRQDDGGDSTTTTWEAMMVGAYGSEAVVDVMVGAGQVGSAKIWARPNQV
jgi:hypothetical protein